MIVKAQENGSPVSIPTSTIANNPVVSDLDPDLADLLATLNDLHKTAQAAIAKHKASLPAPAATAPASPNPFAKKAKFSHFVDKEERDKNVDSDPDLSEGDDDEIEPSDDPDADDIDDDDDNGDSQSDAGDDDTENEQEDEFSVLTRIKKETIDYADEHGKKLPIDSKAQIKSSWAAITKPENAGEYSAIDLTAIKGRIKAAATKADITLPD